MLVLGRFEREVICIGPDIRITVIRAEHGKCRIGIDCPREIPIWREEIGPKQDFDPDQHGGK